MMKTLYLLMVLLLLFSNLGYSQSTETDTETFIIPTQNSWKDSVKSIQYLGMEAYGNSGNLHKSDSTDLWLNNSFAWELYYVASIPDYDWISFGAGIEIGGSTGRNENGTVYDRAGNESFYFVFQAYMNISPWFTLHSNSEGRIEFRSRYTAEFSNSINGNFGHFLLTEVIFGFFIPGNQFDVISGKIDKFWISSPSLEFLYYIQFHEKVGFRWFSKFYVNNGLFYEGSGVSKKEAIPMEHYARFDFILGNGITIWVRAQWNIYNSDFNEWAFFPENNPFDIQLRAGIIFILDFTEKSTKNY